MKGRPSLYDNSPIGISFQKNAKTKTIQVKIIRNRNIDELIDCNFVVPGIPEGAIIHEIVIGEKLSQNLLDRHIKDK